MKISAISIGKTKNIDISNQTVKTAYLKGPVNHSVKVTFAGIEGNEVAVHTDAVYAIAEEHYEYWAGVVGVNPSDWKAGHFAENLTIQGLKEKELEIGDILAIGNSVELEVAGPRIPCFKLAWRMKQADSFITEFAKSGKAGVYFNVVKEGEIKSGDSVEIKSVSKSGLGIEEIGTAAFGATTLETEKLKQLVNHKATSQTVSLVMNTKLYQKIDSQRLFEGQWQGTRQVKVVKVIDEDESGEIKSFYLEATDSKELAPYRAGQFLTVDVPILNEVPNGDTKTRVWSLSDYNEKETKHYRLSIKREVKGAVSPVMHDHITEGALLQIRAPMGQFLLDRGSFLPTLFIAAGIGITPLLAMLKSHFSRSGSIPSAYFIHCVRNKKSQAFRSELDDLQSQYPQLKILYAFSEPDESDQLGKDYSLTGFLKVEHIVDFMKDCSILHGGKTVEIPWYSCDTYICGPQPFQEGLRRALVDNGANSDRIFYEYFSVTASDDEGNEGLSKAEVCFTNSGKTVTWEQKDQETLLDLAEKSGVDASSACKTGLCHTCKVRLIEGEVKYNISLTHPPEKGSILLCCSVPKSSYLKIDL